MDQFWEKQTHRKLEGNQGRYPARHIIWKTVRERLFVREKDTRWWEKCYVESVFLYQKLHCGLKSGLLVSLKPEKWTLWGQKLNICLLKHCLLVSWPCFWLWTCLSFLILSASLSLRVKLTAIASVTTSICDINKVWQGYSNQRRSYIKLNSRLI